MNSRLGIKDTFKRILREYLGKIIEKVFTPIRRA